MVAEQISPEEENFLSQEENNGIYIVFELKNDGQQNIYIDGINPNEIASQSLGVLLFLSSMGKLTPEILKEIHGLLLEKPELAECFFNSIKHSEKLDTQVDAPTMKPSDVFNFRH